MDRQTVGLSYCSKNRLVSLSFATYPPLPFHLYKQVVDVNVFNIRQDVSDGRYVCVSDNNSWISDQFEVYRQSVY